MWYNVSGCCFCVPVSSTGNFGPHVGHKKGSMVQQRSADPLCCWRQNHPVSALWHTPSPVLPLTSDSRHSNHSVHVCRLWDRSSMEEVKTLTFDTSVSSMEYVADGQILVITYGKTIAFYNALRSACSHTRSLSMSDVYKTEGIHHLF